MMIRGRADPLTAHSQSSSQIKRKQRRRTADGDTQLCSTALQLLFSCSLHEDLTGKTKTCVAVQFLASRKGAAPTIQDWPEESNPSLIAYQQPRSVRQEYTMILRQARQRHHFWRQHFQHSHFPYRSTHCSTRLLPVSRRSTVIITQQQLDLQQRLQHRRPHCRCCSFPASSIRSDFSTAAAAAGARHVDNNDNLEDPSKHASYQRTSLQLDFFGEPVTFLLPEHSHDDSIKYRRIVQDHAMAALDGFLLAVVSKGRSCTGGGEELGLDVQSHHSAALSWSQLLPYAAAWNSPAKDANDDANDNRNDNTGGGSRHRQQQRQLRISAPMLAVVSVAPVLAQAGVAYVKHLDSMLVPNRNKKRKDNSDASGATPQIQLYEMARAAVKLKNDDRLNLRERFHLQALELLLDDRHQTALSKLMQLLRQCPGDALALSLAMDVAQTLGDKDAAVRYVQYQIVPASNGLCAPNGRYLFLVAYSLVLIERLGQCLRIGTNAGEGSFVQQYRDMPWRRLLWR